MAFTTLCAVLATLRVIPSRSQFYRYDSINMSCEHEGTSSQWMVKRNTSKNTNEDNFPPLNGTNEFQWFIDALYPGDTGVYWCESAAGECSEAVNINVVDGHVILDSPSLPVTEGENVTLRCSHQTTSTSGLTAHFYKDGRLFRSSWTGNITIHFVSKSHEGMYKCNISGVRGESPESRLAVREVRLPKVPKSPPAFNQLPVLAVCLGLVLVISLTLFCIWKRFKGKLNRDVQYIDVFIIEGVQPNRITDVDDGPTFYSRVKPANGNTTAV